MIKNLKIILWCYIASLLCLTSCSTDINSVESTLYEVIDGNTIRLDNGLTVHINGIKPTSTFTKERLAVYIGQEVNLVTDEEATETTFNSYDDEVWAYVTLSETGEDLGEVLLKEAGEDSFDEFTCMDFHLARYKQIIGPEDEPELTRSALCARITAASMLVYGQNGESGWIGTAFFIGNDGLALTNNHVLRPGVSAGVCLSNTEGVIDNRQMFNVKRIVYTDATNDFTIFYVDMDPTALQRIHYLKLAKKEKSFDRGNRVGIVGNPAPGGNILTMTYSEGGISRIDKDNNSIQTDAQMEHGFSGGPMAAGNARVIGISKSGYEGTRNSFGVDIRIVRQVLDELNLPYAGK